MKLELRRTKFSHLSTKGRLYIDGKFFCQTSEKKDSSLLFNDISDEERKKQITCIPCGRYKITIGKKNKKLAKSILYSFCDGYLPMLVDVPEHDNVLICIGDYGGEAKDGDEISIAVGEEKDHSFYSIFIFQKLYDILKNAEGDIYITIKNSRKL